MRLAYRFEPRLLVSSLVLTVGFSIPDALTAWWFKLLTEALTSRNARGVYGATAGLVLSATGTWIMGTLAGRVNMRFSDKASVAIESHVARLQGTISGIEHHERPEYLDRLQTLRDHVFLLNHVYGSAFGTLGSLIRFGITIALLISVHSLLGLLALFAVPPIYLSARRAGAERQAEESAAQYRRLARHLFELGTSPGPGKEIRVSRTENALIENRSKAWDQWNLGVIWPAKKRSAWVKGAGWAFFGLGYFGTVAFVALAGASPGDIVLVITVGGRLSQFIATTVGESQFLRWCVDASRRLLWLEDYSKSVTEASTATVPAKLKEGIRLENVSFGYPGTDVSVLKDVSLTLPAGAVVAVVGYNGAGKTSLMKLLARFYDPTGGRITVDGTDLSHMPPDVWRARLAGAFQDFINLEFLTRQSVGAGDLARINDSEALRAGASRGGSTDVIESLRSKWDTQLGHTWDAGVELSIGQWQKIALSRGLMRDHPLLVILDEPTASLDAETEHSLFERFASAARDSREDGRITMLVSHRFSTVRMADLIVVLSDGRLVELGSHFELIARRGLYAELYEIQARAYR